MGKGEMLDIQQEFKTGDVVEARFTNSGNYYRFRAKILRVNKSSYSVQPLEPVYPGEDSTKRKFNISKPSFGSHSRWSVNNGVFKFSV